MAGLRQMSDVERMKRLIGVIGGFNRTAAPPAQGGWDRFQPGGRGGRLRGYGSRTTSFSTATTMAKMAMARRDDSTIAA